MVSGRAGSPLVLLCGRHSGCGEGIWGLVASSLREGSGRLGVGRGAQLGQEMAAAGQLADACTVVILLYSLQAGSPSLGTDCLPALRNRIPWSFYGVGGGTLACKG